MADFDLEALSLGELKKMQRDVAKAISTYQDRQKAEARAKVEAFARDLGYSLAELIGAVVKTARAPPQRNTATLRTRHSPGPVVGVNRSGSLTRWTLAQLPMIWKSADRVPTLRPRNPRRSLTWTVSVSPAPPPSDRRRAA